jgi:WhiB family transcriptional regulator, redox-sensing transcriptional regulator
VHRDQFVISPVRQAASASEDFMTMAEHQDWREQGACLSANPDLFFPISSRGASAGQIARAKGICAGCPVREPCLSFALSTQQQFGIWGGTTEDERKKMRRRARRQPARADRARSAA